jgi:hypothetical protein
MNLGFSYFPIYAEYFEAWKNGSIQYYVYMLLANYKFGIIKIMV